VEFNNKTVTAHGNFALIETFKRAIGMEKMIEKKFSLEKAPNSKFKANEILDRVIDCCIVGDSRFMYTEELRRDEGYRTVKGIEEFPSEKCFRNFFGAFDDDGVQIGELKAISDEIIRLRSRVEGPKEVWLDYDDTVIELFGNQEGGKVGYNPRYRGRPSLKARVCFVSETKDWIDIDLIGITLTRQRTTMHMIAMVLEDPILIILQDLQWQ
jgi:hypothetical protein